MEPITITLNQLTLLLLLVWASGTIGLALLLKVSWWHLTTFFAVGAGMGLAWSALYYFNVKRQAEHNQMVRGSSRQIDFEQAEHNQMVRNSSKQTVL